MTFALSLVDRLGYSTIRIECKLINRRIATGTGFFFNFRDGGGRIIPAIVTNRHIIEKAVMGRLRFTAAGKDGTPDNGNYYTFNMYDFEGRWVPHPDMDVDLCAMPIAAVLAEMRKKGIDIYYEAYDVSHIPSRNYCPSCRPSKIS